jgi:translation initiation factor 3 subunit B
LDCIQVTKTKVYERVEANVLYWSPTGRHLVIAGMGTIQGAFMFVDTMDMEAREMASGSHVNASELMWDPTGRYVATVVSAYQGLQHDTGYMIWSFQGKALQRVQHSKFYMLAWRPRPPSLLTKKARLAIEKGGYKVYEPRFTAEDKMEHTRASGEVLEKREKMMTVWNRYLREVGEMFSHSTLHTGLSHATDLTRGFRGCVSRACPMSRATRIMYP